MHSTMNTLAVTVQGETWLTSDWHLGHQRIIELCGRPFDTVADMDEALITYHNELVEQRDTVWMLGDMIMGDIETGLARVRQMNGRKILIAGNHDRCFHGYEGRGGLEYWRQRYLDAGFTAIVDGRGISRTQTRGGRDVNVGHAIHLPLGPGRTPVAVSHFPYEGESGDGADRYRQYRPRREKGGGRWLFHGHVHTQWQAHQRQINVGVDVWNFRPVPAEILTDMIRDEEDPK